MAEEKTSRVVQITASTVAAVAAAFLGSRLGVAGTTIGAGLGSVVTMSVTSLTEGGLTRTSVKLRRRIAVREEGDPSVATTHLRPVQRPVEPVLTATRRQFPTRWMLTGAVAAFVVCLGVISLIEWGIGKPISGGNEGTTLTGLVGGATSRPTTPTTTRSAYVGPPVTSVPPTEITTPSVTLSPTLSEIPSLTTSPTTTTPSTTSVTPSTISSSPVLIPSVG